ncbi:hypothetical protein [Mycobacterium sp. NPDC050853]|uniref:hypothetical protein n=1 Tax=Mycobacterium sp. NPDC050853 TaxID=3155160 RepID=UPI0033CED5E4
MPERFTKINLRADEDPREQMVAYWQDLAKYLHRELRLGPHEDPPTHEVMTAIGAPVSEWYRHMLMTTP